MKGANRARTLLLRSGVIAGLLGGATIAMAQGATQPAPAATFAAQVELGRTAYAQHCAACHGQALVDGQFAAALKGRSFLLKWGDEPISDLFDYIHRSMPPANAGGLPDETYAAIAALILSENGASNPAPLSANPAQLAFVELPAAPAPPARPEAGVGGLSPRHPLPPGPVIADRFANYIPVTEEMLSNPAPENWLSWRRAHNGQGFSPLRQVDTGNVNELRIAWAQALPPGVNMNEPLVRDGVLYVFGYGDSVHAFDAATGRSLWTYQRRLPQGTPLNSRKTIALFGDKLYTATSDNHMVALDARTGRPVWDVLLTDRAGLRIPGGPLAADGVIMQGFAATRTPGGGLIVAIDAETGAKLWEFETLAKPGQPGGDTWNGIPAQARNGGSQWTSGTYDAVTGLALWGVAQTYDTGPLRDRNPGMNNDALFTNSTLAFVPRTGELKWYFQHVRNDQYDLDWVFDRVIGTIEVDGAPRRVVMTSGKEGLFDALDAATGQYIKTVDMGLQDFIERIDPVTGDKIPKADKLPGRDRGVVFMCPHGGGGRNWTPTSFNPNTRLLFVTARDICMDIVPTDSPGFLTTGVNIQYAARPGSDGNYGVLQALDMESGEIVWETRRRQTFDMGVLTTAGGVLFTGGMDRQFLAYDQATGRELWRTGVTGVPNASPITYSVDGKQYVAMVTGHGNPLAFGVPDIIPETQLPPVNSSAIYVFALPE